MKPAETLSSILLRYPEKLGYLRTLDQHLLRRVDEGSLTVLDAGEVSTWASLRILLRSLVGNCVPTHLYLDWWRASSLLAQRGEKAAPGLLGFTRLGTFEVLAKLDPNLPEGALFLETAQDDFYYVKYTIKSRLKLRQG